MYHGESPDNEESAAPRTPFEGQYKALILEQLRRIQEGTAISSLINREWVPYDKDEKVGRDSHPCVLEGRRYLTLPIQHAERYGVITQGALQVIDTIHKPSRGLCVLVPEDSYSTGQETTAVSKDNAVAIAALEQHPRFELAA